jgi:hypothetical protein
MNKLINATIIILLLPSISLAYSVYQKNDMRTGKFIYVGEHNGFVVERTENYQVEYNNETGYKIEFKIEWLNDNEYNMIFIGGTKGCLVPGDIIKVKMESYTIKGYKYIADCGRCGGIMKGEFIKIK